MSQIAAKKNVPKHDLEFFGHHKRFPLEISSTKFVRDIGTCLSLVEDSPVMSFKKADFRDFKFLGNLLSSCGASRW